MEELKSLGDSELLAALSTIVRRGNAVAADLLAHLGELDERQVFVDLGFSSLFAYCVESLGLCEATAGRHIAVARVCRAYPEALAKMTSGELHVSALSLMKHYLNPENAAELFELCSRRSARKIEELLAVRFPKADVRDSVRRLPTQRTLDVESGPHESPPLERRIEIPTQRAEAEKPRRLEPLSADRFGVHFTADREFLELLERVRGLAGHRLPSGDLMTLMKRGLEAYERELEKERFAVGRKPRRVTAKGLQARGRWVPAAVKREVYVRDGKRCTFVAADGRRCASTRFLELDHVQPWAVGGEASVSNLRLRCRAHNQLAARRYFGAAWVRAARGRARARARGSEPQGASNGVARSRSSLGCGGDASE